MNTENQNLNDEKLISQVRETLDDSVNRIDAETSQRIIAARQQALTSAPKKFTVPKLLTAAATAFSILLAVVIVNVQLNKPLESESVEALELIASQDTFELYEELEFYTWLAEEDVTG